MVHISALNAHGGPSLAYLILHIQIIQCRPTFQQTQSISITFAQHRPDVFDVDPTLYKYYTIFCALLPSGGEPYIHRFNNSS